LSSEDQAKRFAVVVLASPGVEDAPRLERQLTDVLLTALRRPSTVGSVREFDGVDTLRSLPDVDVALIVCGELGVTRLMLARILPSPAPAPARATVSVLDSSGAQLRFVEADGLLVLPSHEEKPAPRIWNPTPAPRVWEPAMEPSTPAPPPSPPSSPLPDRIAEFKRRALTLRIVQDPDGVTPPQLELLRQGQPLDAAALKDLQAPAPPSVATSTPEAGSSRTVTALLLPAGPLLTGACGSLAAVVPPLLVGALGVLGGATDGTGEWFMRGAWFTVLGGLLCSPFACAGAGALGLLLGGPLTGYGIYRLTELPQTEPAAVEASHPYVAFVTTHNRALARDLDVPSTALGKKYFPAQRRR
jgi:hypothetical protein